MENSGKLILIEDIDFTPSGLRNYLEEKYSLKLSGEPFTFQDISGYTRKGFLPVSYGGAKIEVVTSKKIGIKILRLTQKHA